MDKKRVAIVLNVMVIGLEILGFSHSISDRGLGIFAYYTQISNLITLFSCVLFVLVSHKNESSKNRILRYLSSCLLTMTALMTTFVLIPLGGSVHGLLFSGNGLYHHLLCPIVSVASYLFFETHYTSKWAVLVPNAVTAVYGIILIAMNVQKKYDGPYPFFRYYEQGTIKTIMWMVVLVICITVFSTLIRAVSIWWDRRDLSQSA
ncbi:hypothetical protein KHM83_12415 [Fusibacter paucivorans]|uniref:ABC transporter permease n=1 Tax=Fusibacter paucivorans TaxID=76009 RepID=A0ABS5PQS6_9FIRM|nr:hypothetical protein [Fusibacter paucivorans]MBS7527480.1 hypothetical protein [Fusibacter paucivorans]